jgi:hypothetical protein
MAEETDREKSDIVAAETRIPYVSTSSLSDDPALNISIELLSNTSIINTTYKMDSTAIIDNATLTINTSFINDTIVNKTGIANTTERFNYAVFILFMLSLSIAVL